jgi:hypothetical protein
MRLLGNKTHGDLAEIGLATFINLYLNNYESRHVGKELFRSKEKEEDILIKDKSLNETFAVSIKAYGDGPLQLSTDKNSDIFNLLKKYGKEVYNKNTINEIFKEKSVVNLINQNTLPLIYREKEMLCNILVFDFNKAIKNTNKIVLIEAGENTNGVQNKKQRIHPIYVFYDKENNYIFEVRYGGATANALQRGVWTNTKRSINYFYSATDGWINYTHNLTLIDVIKYSLCADENFHKKIVKDIYKK